MNGKHVHRLMVPVLVGGLSGLALAGLSACGEEEAAPSNAAAPNNSTNTPAGVPAGNTSNVQTVAINETCPVGGEPIDPAVTVEYENATIAFCCNDCKGEWDSADEEGKARLAAKARGAVEGAGGSGG
jgi:hypothetical protein